MREYRIRNVLPCLAIGLVACAARGNQTLSLDKIKLPPGFSISIYATGVPNAREMALGSNGTLFAGSMNAGNVYAVVDHDSDNRADEVIKVANGLNMPSGIAFRNGSLYVAEVSRVTRYDNIEAQLKNPPKPVVVNDKFPHETHHGWKFIAFGPDGLLYVPVGAPCNVCRPDERHAVINRMNADGSGLEVFATGIRNTVGFDWHPQTKEFRFSGLPRRRHHGSRCRARALSQVHTACDQSGPARGCYRNAVLHGHDVSARISQSDFYRRTRFLESKYTDWLPDHLGPT